MTLLSHNEICHECSLKVKIPELNQKQKAVCPRCGFVLAAHHPNAIDRILAFSFAAIVFAIATMKFNFLSINANGQRRSIDFPSSFTILMDNDFSVLAFIEAITIFAIPLLILMGFIYVLLPLRNGKYVYQGIKVLTMTFVLIPWGMVEIFLIGTLVSLIKVQTQADISLGPSFFAFILFSISMSAALLHVDKRQLLRSLNLAAANSQHGKQDLEYERQLAAKIALERSRHAALPVKLQCHFSVQRTWALIFTASVLYFPANFLPIMTTRSFGQDDPNTILGGVIKLWNMGSYPIAVIIFVASVVVPVIKILALAWLNFSVQQRSEFLTSERVKLYRVAEFIGRWSMIDVYAVIILVSLIQLGTSMTILPGSAILAFSAVVIVTMLAAITFDQKLIWNNRDPHGI